MKPLNYLVLACLAAIAFIACNNSLDEDAENKQLVQAIIQDEDFAEVVDNQTLNKGRYESSLMAINFWLDMNITNIGALSKEEYLSLRERQRQKAAAFSEKLQERQTRLEKRLDDMRAQGAEMDDAAWKKIKTEEDEQLGIPVKSISAILM